MNSLAPPRVLDFAHISPATRLLDKRRQMFEVQEALLSQKEEFARREDALRRREDALRRKDIDLQESLIKFNKFLQENENKKNRALRRIVEERKLLEMKETEKRELEQKESNLLAEKSELDAEVSQHLRYKDYLDLVASTSSKGSTEISEILNRYKTLKEVHRQLMDAQQTAEKSKEDLQREYIVSTKERTNKLLNSNNDISKLKEVLELEHTHTQDVQEENDELTQKYSAKTLELGQVLASITNILARCEESFRLRHNKPPRAHDKTEGLPLAEQCRLALLKLEELSRFMVDFQSLVREEAHARAVASALNNGT